MLKREKKIVIVGQSKDGFLMIGQNVNYGIKRLLIGGVFLAAVYSFLIFTPTNSDGWKVPKKEALWAIPVSLFMYLFLWYKHYLAKKEQKDFVFDNINKSIIANDKVYSTFNEVSYVCFEEYRHNDGEHLLNYYRIRIGCKINAAIIFETEEDCLLAASIVDAVSNKLNKPFFVEVAQQQYETFEAANLATIATDLKRYKKCLVDFETKTDAVLRNIVSERWMLKGPTYQAAKDILIQRKAVSNQ